MGDKKRFWASLGVAILFSLLFSGTVFWWLSKPYFTLIAESKVVLKTLEGPAPQSTSWYYLLLGPLPFEASQDLGQNIGQNGGEIKLRPVFPYKKGPPKLFPQAVRLEGDHIYFEIRGPKTHDFSIASAKSCFSEIGFSLECMKLRWSYLRPLFEGLRESGHFVKRMFLLEESKEEIQRIFLEGEIEGAKGNFSAVVILSKAEEGKSREQLIVGSGINSELFEEWANEIFVSPTLGPGQAQADAQVSKVAIAELQNLTNYTNFRSHAFEILEVLCSHATVRPERFQTYFHLAGVSFLLGKRAQKEPRSPLTEKDIGYAKSMLRSALLYARDVDPADPKLVEIENMALKF